MKIISWNVNGLNAAIKKGLLDFIEREKADVYCFQEVKVSEEKLNKSIHELDAYTGYWHFAEKKGYSGTLTLSRMEPNSVTLGTDKKGFDNEGRTITLEFNKFYIVNCYFPNAGRSLDRLDYKVDFNSRILRYLQRLRKSKPIIITGDFNVVHKDIDIHWERPIKDTERFAGLTLQERQWFDRFLNKGYVDTFREFTNETGHYTWWSMPTRSREKNKGWRLDYFVISEELRPHLVGSTIMNAVHGSDHCPISLTMNLE